MSRFVAAAAAIALVVSGMAIGGFGTYLVLQHPRWQGPLRPPPPPPRRPLPFTRDMDSRLDLSEDQRRKIDEILRAGHDEADVIRQELRPRLEAHLAATRARIAAVLTPEQRAKFETLVREDRRRADRFLIDGPPGPPGPPDDGPPR